MKTISLAQHTTPAWTPPEMIFNAARIGYDAVSIRSIPQGVQGEKVYSLSADKAMYERTEKAIAETGVRIHDVDLVAIHEQTDISALEPELESVAKIGAKGVVSSIWTENEALYTEKFGALCNLCRQYGLTVNLEFVTWAVVKSVQQGAKLLRNVGAENARILLDTIHWYRSRCSLEDILACPAQWFDLVHICDAPAAIPQTNEELISTCRTQRLYSGEGAIPIADVLRTIPQAETCAIEIPNLEYTMRFGAFEHAARAYATLQDYLKKNHLD